MFYLKFRRIEQGLTQHEIAHRTGIHRLTVCHIENGRVNPTDDEFDQIAKGAETSVVTSGVQSGRES